ncbi:Alpha/Beta hydrolase protein [Mycena maculata]|uniref:Alpha/Beta hydrolase protein n=1 Tax=Mycena maculata TaxID=230809 RepID=A0AAD7NIQ5_9AGAR|nr:Alpha/Beta hydrolase protein [Mycena maculata]
MTYTLLQKERQNIYDGTPKALRKSKMFSSLSILAPLLVFFSSISGTLTQTTEGALHRRTYLYVGQTYVPQGNSTIAAEQMYVERLTPAEVTQPLPILFIHGMGMTGSNLLSTPDERLGWADYFLGQGYELYIVDQPSRGRSPWQPGVDGVLTTLDTFTVESHFTAVQLYDLWPQAALHTQWPGNGSVGDPVFDKFYASTVPSLNSSTEESFKIKHAGSQLLDQIGPVIVMTHSQAGEFGWVLGDSRPDQVKAIVALEPFGPPPPITSASDIARVVVSEAPGFTCFQQAQPARKLINLVDIPVLVVTSEASYHAIYDNCTVDYLRAAGVSVEHISLGDVGIHGNAHMFFMEKNNFQIVEKVIQPWISKIRA